MFLGGPPPSNGSITAGGFGQLNQGGNSNPFGGSIDWGQGGGTQPPVSPFGSFGMNGGNTQPPAPQFDQGTLGSSLTGTNAPGTPLPTNGGMMPIRSKHGCCPCGSRSNDCWNDQRGFAAAYGTANGCATNGNGGRNTHQRRSIEPK